MMLKNVMLQMGLIVFDTEMNLSVDVKMDFSAETVNIVRVY